MFGDGSAIAGLRKALRSMKRLEEMIVVRDMTMDTRPRNHGMAPKVQMKFLEGGKNELVEMGFPADVEELPNAEKDFKIWKPSKSVKKSAVYAWRTL